MKKLPITEILSVFIAMLSIIVSIFLHFDTKRSTQHDIVKALSERYESVDQEMSYEEALETVDREIEKLNNENSLILKENEDLKQEITVLKNEYDTSEKISIADSYAKSGNYDIAISLLNSITNKTEDIDSLLENYTLNYEISVITNAETLANDGNFEEAVDQIDNALKIIPNSQTLLDKKVNITPQYLVDTIECYKSENLWLLDSKEYIKMSGNSYRHAIFSQSSDIGVTMLNRSYSANAFYNLDGQYKQLSGIIGHIDFSGSGTIGENDGGQVYDAEISIWGDDQEIKTVSLLSDDTAEEFNVSIEGVKILEFRVKCSGNSKVGIAEIQIR